MASRSYSCLLALAIGPAAYAAPARPSPDVIEGTLDIAYDRAPVVHVLTDDGSVTYWLVFATREAEQQDHKIEPGSRVRVTGQLGAGGVYRYVVVRRVDTTE